MAVISTKNLPIPEEIRQKFPLSKDLEQKIQFEKQEIADIIEGKNSRKILIIGPCSAWPSESVIKYAQKLKPLSDQVSDKLKIVLRCYTQKPRTILGWTGAGAEPDPFAAADFLKGIEYCRQMMISVSKIGLPLADELLYLSFYPYISDLLSWGALGARSTEDPEHRNFASSLEFPVGIKNPTSGSLLIAMNSLLAAQHPHSFVLNNQQINTDGNKLSHLVLRGGRDGPNFSRKNLLEVSQLFNKAEIKNPAIVVDASHDNSLNSRGKKDYKLQESVILDTIKSMKQEKSVAQNLKGWMVESFLFPGNQKLISREKITEGQSITDACLGFEQSQRLIENIYKRL